MQDDTGYELHDLLLSNSRVQPGPPRRRRNWLSQQLEGFNSWFQLYILRSGRYRGQVVYRADGKWNDGWKFGTFMSCIVVGTVLCFNIAFTIYVMTVMPPTGDGVGEITSGKCESILSTSTKIHILINVFSTIVVAASNYNMQLLSSPTRTEIDKAHQRRKPMQIGVQSLKNLRYIPLWRVVLWVALLVSTLPLHFLWNSAIFSVTALVEYAGVVVNPDFLSSAEATAGLNCSESAMSAYKLDNTDQQSFVTCSLLEDARQQKLEQLSPTDCIKRYNLKLTTGGYNFIAVTKDLQANQSRSFPPAHASLPVLAFFDTMSYSPTLATWCTSQCNAWCTPWNETCTTNTQDWSAKLKDTPDMWCDPTNRTVDTTTSFACYKHATNGTTWKPNVLQGSSDWICDPDQVYERGCSTSAALKSVSNWKILPERYEIDHCLASEAINKCQLRYSSSILITVVICNAIKFVAILLNLLFSHTTIFATIGDAVSSFLSKPDIFTEGDCLYTTGNIISSYYRPVTKWSGPSHWRPRKWHDPKSVVRWIHGVCSRDLIIMWITWHAYLIVTSFFLYVWLQSDDRASMLQTGFGALNMSALIGTSTYKGGSNASILTTSLIVNLPQVVFSSLYFVYNSMFTSMAAAWEWSLLGSVRKSLRVTSPSGLQRSTYWLQLPWKYSIPLLCMTALLHWLISQSIFLVNVRIQATTDQFLPGPDEFFDAANEEGYITGLGYSPVPIICALGVGLFMFVSLFGVGSMKLKPGVPIVENNSLAISAACHPSGKETEPATKPILWGVTKHQDDVLIPGHCSLSSLEVDRPIAGSIYA